MKKNLKILLPLILSSLLIGCASSREFKKAQKLNTLESYKLDKEKFPHNNKKKVNSILEIKQAEAVCLQISFDESSNNQLRIDI